MDCVSEGFEHAFMEGFRHGGVGMHCARDVFQNGTHLQGQNEFAMKLRNMAANCLYA